jgi:membrane protease YdiL (CAAX protease family)
MLTSTRRRVLAIYVVAFATPLLYPGAARAAAECGFGPTAMVAASYVAVVLVGAVGVWLLVTRWSGAPSIAPIVPPRRPCGLPALGCDSLMVLLAVSGIILTAMVLGPFGTDPAAASSSASVGYTVIKRFGSSVLTPLVEEIGGRWLLYRGLRPLTANNDTSMGQRLATVAPAAVISGVLFALGHYLVSSPERIILTVPMGVILAVTYELSGRIWVPFAIHTFINLQSNLTAEFGPSGRYPVLLLIIALSVTMLVSLMRNDNDLRQRNSRAHPRPPAQ